MHETQGGVMNIVSAWCRTIGASQNLFPEPVPTETFQSFGRLQRTMTSKTQSCTQIPPRVGILLVEKSKANTLPSRCESRKKFEGEEIRAMFVDTPEVAPANGFEDFWEQLIHTCSYEQV